MSKTLLGLVGLAGAGKSTAIEVIQSTLDAESIYFGGIVLAEVQRRGLPVEQASEKLVREELRAKDGMAAIAKLALPAILKAFETKEIALVDGIYSWEEVEVLKASGEFNLLLLAVHADRAVREERVSKRPVRPLTPEGLWARDLSEVAGLDKVTPIALADHHVVNNGDLEFLKVQLDSVLERVRA